MIDITQGNAWTYLTGNGQWLLIMDELIGDVYVYRFNLVEDRYTLFQHNLTANDQSEVYTGIISEDG